MSIVIKNPDKPKKEKHRDVRLIKEHRYPKDAVYIWIEFDRGYHIEYPEKQYALLLKEDGKYKGMYCLFGVFGYKAGTLSEAFRYVDSQIYETNPELWVKTNARTVLNEFDSDIDDYIKGIVFEETKEV